jgi:uncharacterized lipoprotein YajG
MKKFNFFPVLLVALLMLCGFSSNAQTLKSPVDAIQGLEVVIKNASSIVSASTDVEHSSANANVGKMFVRAELAKSLQIKIKASQNVAKSLAELYAKHVTSDAQTLIFKDELDFISTQLLN